MKLFTTKQTVLILSILVLLVSTFSIAHAYVDVLTTTPITMGYAPGYGGDGSSGIKLKLRNDGDTVGTWTSGTTRWFYLNEALGDRGMATVLSALSMEKTALVRIEDDAAANNSLISIVYLNE